MNDTPLTLTHYVRRLTTGILDPLAQVFYRARIHPDTITIVGLVIVLIASWLIGRGDVQWGGVLLILGLPLDALDGAVARAMKREDKFGGLLDSTLDRYADGLIFAALGYYFASQDQLEYLLLALAALLGSFTVSYVRARAGEAGISVQAGWFTRLERVAILIPALLVPVFLVPGMWILAIGTNFTGFQRLWFVYKRTDFTEM